MHLNRNLDILPDNAPLTQPPVLDIAEAGDADELSGDICPLCFAPLYRFDGEDYCPDCDVITLGRLAPR